MKKNMGNLDRVTRVTLAAIMGIMFWAGIVPGSVITVSGIITLALIVTGAAGFCPLYAPFKFNTLKYNLPTIK